MSRRRDEGTGATITELTYQGRTVDLKITDKGIFYTIMAEDRIEARSLDGLKDKVKRAIDALGKIEIPITLITGHYSDDEPELQDALLLRLRRGRAVVRYANSREDVIAYNEDTCRRLSAGEKQKVIDTWKTYKAAEQAWEDLRTSVAVEATTLLQEAQEAIDAK